MSSSTESKIYFGKAAKITIVTILMIAIAVGSAFIVHKNVGDSVPASTTVENGLSAYELAVQYGYEGTIQEWLDSLNGKSACEIAKESGYTGSETDWTASLKATAGKDGVGIKTAAFSNSNELLITLTDGTVLNLGVADGQNGIGIATSEINNDGELVITYTNGQTANLGIVIGAKGDKGDTGAAGQNGTNGISIINSVINSNGELVLTFKYSIIYTVSADYEK